MSTVDTKQLPTVITIPARLPATKSSQNVANGVRNVFNECQNSIVRLVLFLAVMVCSFGLSLIALEAITKRNHMFRRQRPVYFEQPKMVFLATSESQIDSKQVVILGKILDTFPDHLVELFVFENETAVGAAGDELRQHGVPLIKLLLRLFSEKSYAANSVENMLAYFQVKHSNFHVHRMCFGYFFRYTQLERTWRELTVRQRLLAARVLLVWQRSGLSFDLQNTGNRSLADVIGFIGSMKSFWSEPVADVNGGTVAVNGTGIVMRPPYGPYFNPEFAFLASKFQCNLFMENLLEKIRMF